MSRAPSLPAYKVKESGRARHIRIRVTPKDGVVVTVPQGFPRARLPALLREKQAWMEARLQESKAWLADFPPHSIRFHALNQTWQVLYQSTDSPKIHVHTQEEGRILHLSGDIRNTAALQRCFHQWFIAQGKQYLVPRLNALSELAGLPYFKAGVRGQKTRWASCSGRKTITLNYKLLFLPGAMARYVMLHELAHTVHLNHSPAFWAFVEKLEPDYQHIEQNFDSAGRQYVPAWVECL